MGFFDFLDPGPNGRNTGPTSDIQSWVDDDLSNLQFDAAGFPVGHKGPPAADKALHVQFEAERATEQRRNTFFQDALGTSRQGARNMESYRPGGAAALRSGIYGQQANLLYGIGQQQRTPDMLSDFRRDAQAKADIEARRSARLQNVLAVINTGVSVAGAIAGMPSGGGDDDEVKTPEQEVAGQVSALPQPNSQAARAGPEAGLPPAPTSSRSGPGPVQTRDSAISSEGGGPSSGGASPAPGSGGSGAKAATGGASPSSAGGGMAMPSGGYGQDGMFTSTALAAAGTRVDPNVERIVTMNRAQDLDRDEPFWQAADYAVGRILEHAMAGIE